MTSPLFDPSGVRPPKGRAQARVERVRLRPRDRASVLPREGASERGSAGIATVEFAVLLPFLMILIVGVLDLSVALTNYFVLTQIVREGVRIGVGIPNMMETTVDSDDDDFAAWDEACVTVPGPSGLPCGHMLVHRRVRRLIDVAPDVRAEDASDFDLITEFVDADPDAGEPDRFAVTLRGTATGFFGSWPIRVRQVGPYLNSRTSEL